MHSCSLAIWTQAVGDIVVLDLSATPCCKWSMFRHLYLFAMASFKSGPNLVNLTHPILSPVNYMSCSVVDSFCHIYKNCALC